MIWSSDITAIKLFVATKATSDFTDTFATDDLSRLARRLITADFVSAMGRVYCANSSLNKLKVYLRVASVAHAQSIAWVAIQDFSVSDYQWIG